MNRTIKFKVWDKYKNYFNSDYAINGTLVWWACEQSVIQEKEHLVFLQFTGLLDKNWKEIYEWDIFDMWVIQFSEGCFNGCYIAHTTSDKWWDYSDEWEDGIADYVSKNEVKWNIYENPELLK